MIVATRPLKRESGKSEIFAFSMSMIVVKYGGKEAKAVGNLLVASKAAAADGGSGNNHAARAPVSAKKCLAASRVTVRLDQPAQSHRRKDPVNRPEGDLDIDRRRQDPVLDHEERSHGDEQRGDRRQQHPGRDLKRSGAAPQAQKRADDRCGYEGRAGPSERPAVEQDGAVDWVADRRR